jgi:replicative DNA helicase
MGNYYETLRARALAIGQEHKMIAAGEDPMAIIPTGLREFDKRAGHKRKILHLYGAATGEGKSIWKIHLAKHAAKAGYRVGVLDFEDPEERTADRDFSAETGINNAKMMAGDLSDKEVAQIMQAMKSMGWAKNIELEAGLKDAEDAVEWLYDQKPLDLVIVDYLSALPHGKNGRERAISDFCWKLTSYAQERFEDDKQGAAVVAMAQLVGDVSERGLRMYEQWKRNQQYKNEGSEVLPYIEGFRGFDNSDLAWCKDAGRNAKEMGFMFRPGRYYKRLVPNCKVEDNVMEFSFPKKNFGAEGTIAVGFDGRRATLFDLPEGKGKR